VDFALVLLAYLLGSLNASILVSRAFGEDIRHRDLPGTSGVFRQYGPAWGIAVFALDIAKGVLAAFLAGLGTAAWVIPLSGFAVVSGHIYPVFFGFRGGGGLAPSIGYLLYLYPLEAAAALAFGLALAGVYYLVYWSRSRRGVYPLPFASPFGYVFLFVMLRDDATALLTVALIGVVILVRGLQLLRR
jgi:acyl phosphate:glycerol-3-phosphate acyltransferase